MQVNQEYSPVTITLDTWTEMDMLWNILEETYPNYDGDKRRFLIDIVNALSEKDNEPT